MKFFNQEGASIDRTQVHQSDNICDCCKTFDHQATEYHHDDAVCDKCQALCCCGCHRPR